MECDRWIWLKFEKQFSKAEIRVTIANIGLYIIFLDDGPSIAGVTAGRQGPNYVQRESIVNLVQRYRD